MTPTYLHVPRASSSAKPEAPAIHSAGGLSATATSHTPVSGRGARLSAHANLADAPTSPWPAAHALNGTKRTSRGVWTGLLLAHRPLRGPRPKTLCHGCDPQRAHKMPHTARAPLQPSPRTRQIVSTVRATVRGGPFLVKKPSAPQPKASEITDDMHGTQLETQNKSWAPQIFASSHLTAW